MNRASTPTHAGHNDASYNTALRGASLAFQKTGQSTASSPATPATRNTPNSTLPSRDPSHLLTPSKQAAGDTRSPSLIAATLAASRSVSPSPKPTPVLHTSNTQAVKEHRKGNVGGGDSSTVSSVTDLDLTTDASSIPPTTALISLFERREHDTDPVKKSPAPAAKRGPKAGLQQPITPPRIMSPAVSPSPNTTQGVIGARSPLRDVRGAGLKVSTSLTPPTKKLQTVNRPNTLDLPTLPSQASISKTIAKVSDTGTGSTRPPVPKPRKQRPNTMTIAGAHSTTSNSSEVPRRMLARRSSSSSSNDTFVSASSAPSPQPDSPRRRSPPRLGPEKPQTQRPRPRSANPAPAPPPPRPPMRQSRSSLPLDSLASAIVAGSLASARATPGPTKPPTPPPRKPTPHMRQTMRAPRAKSDEDVNGISAQHKKKPLGKLSSRKKHAHHEGARRRWRETLTVRERQRYEGLWASNRGLLLDSPSGTSNSGLGIGQLVANVVVRDIWARSRLPFDELAEVWDLVDTQDRGVLDKAGFVVGMWLIDQRLRGRKIPTRVSESVWGSVKGVRVPTPKSKK
ncbi:hypothetical protein F4808DRAFT_422551 [Astrocystis sublimbata]|nr:hypothetical protein F4808DRAFT_422551 [Astrocystis sublimbata]